MYKLTYKDNNLFLSIFFLLKDECSFVSLRDVERAMQVMVWFYNHVDTRGRLMRKVIGEQRREEGLDVDEDDDEEVITSFIFSPLYEAAKDSCFILLGASRHLAINTSQISPTKRSELCLTYKCYTQSFKN